MKLLVYNVTDDKSGCFCEQIIDRITEMYETLTFRSMGSFLEYLHKPSEPGEQVIVLFRATMSSELDVLAEYDDLLFSYRLVIIVPDNTPDMIRRGHLLRPRYLAIDGNDVSMVCQVIDNMIKQAYALEQSLKNQLKIDD